MNRDEIDRKIREIIASRTNDQSIFSLSKDDPLAKLGIDSLAFGWIVADVEDTFDFMMMGSDVIKLKTMNMAVDYVEKKIL